MSDKNKKLIIYLKDAKQSLESYYNKGFNPDEYEEDAVNAYIKVVCAYNLLTNFGKEDT